MNVKSFWILVILLVFLLFSWQVKAQEVENMERRQTVTRKRGDKALSFYFNDFAIDEFYGGIGGRYWTSGNKVVFGSLDLGFSYSEQEDDFNNESGDITFSLGLENHFYVNHNISPYWGLIGSLGYSYDKQEHHYEKDYYLSAGIILGVEYWVVKNISLAGQYHCLVIFGEKEEIKYISMGTNPTSIILSMYF